MLILKGAEAPMFIGSAAYCKDTPKLRERFTFTTPYDEAPVEAFTTVGCPTGVLAVPRNAGFGVGALDKREDGEAIEFAINFKAQKPEQDQVIANSLALMQQDEDFIIQAPTGWGKTYVGSAIAAHWGRRFCVITTKEDIIDQWLTAICSVGGLKPDEVGVWRANQTPKPEHKAVISLVHSVLKGPDRYGEEAYRNFGLVLCDEVHRMGAEEFSQAMWHFNAKRRLGMSATPYRKDGKDKVFKWHIGPVRVSAKQEVMIPKVLIANTPWKVPVTYRNGRAVKMPHSPGRTMHLAKYLSASKPRNAMAVDFLKSCLAKERSTVVFSDTMEQLYAIYAALQDEGVDKNRIGWYVGISSPEYGDNSKTKKAVREAMKVRPIILATYAMASEATDIPWLDTCVLMSPRSDVVQIVGRIRREYPNKKQPVVLDLVDNDSSVFTAYAGKRQAWYAEIGCEVKWLNNA